MSDASRVTAGAPSPAASRVLVPTVMWVFGIAVANSSSGAIAQPAIADAFDAGAADVGAIVFGYAASFAIMTAVYGSLARRFGLARCLAFGTSLLGLGAAIAVAAVSLEMLIAARVIQGLGAGAIPTLSMALISRQLTGTARARALGMNVAAVGIGFAMGPLAGGLLLEAFGWRGAVALGLAALPAVLVIPRLDRDPGDPAARLDIPGIGLLAVAVGGTVLAINRLPVLGFGWLVGALGTAVTMAFALLIRRSRGKPEPALPLRELASPVLRRAMLLGYVGQTGFFGTLVLAPIVAARVHGVQGAGLGLLLLPMAILIAVVSPRNGRLVERIGRRGTTTVSLAVIGLSALFLASQGPGAPLGMLVAGLLVSGFGFGLLSAPLAGEVSRTFGDARRPAALGIYNLAFFMGMASGSAISTAFVQSQIELGILNGRPLPGGSTGLLILALFPLAALAYDRLRPVSTPAALESAPPA